MFKTWDELSEVEQLETIYSDAHKEAYGFRPRGYGELTVDELRSRINHCSEAIARAQDEEREREEEIVAAFEERILVTIVNGAADRETAIRWILQAEDLEEDFEYDRDFVCFKLGLPYGFFKNEVQLDKYSISSNEWSWLWNKPKSSWKF